MKNLKVGDYVKFDNCGSHYPMEGKIERIYKNGKIGVWAETGDRFKISKEELR